MSIKAEIIKDSINSLTYDRLTTFVVTFPRFINAEVLRHRALSFSSASSRAIPVKKLLQDIEENPAVPVWWGKNQSGMGADVELDDLQPYHIEHDTVLNLHKRYTQKEWAQKLWLELRFKSIEMAKQLLEVDLHKQISNRVLEPFQNITLIISGTEWDNFFKLRASTYAQPEFRVLAEKMLELYNLNIPTIKEPITKYSKQVFLNEEVLSNNNWHIPYEDKMTDNITNEEKLKIAIARCARVSYLTQDGEINKDKDVELYTRLVSNNHFSPTEHVAIPIYGIQNTGNFKGWKQYRKFLLNENQIDSRVKKYKVVNGEVK